LLPQQLQPMTLTLKALAIPTRHPNAESVRDQVTNNIQLAIQYATASND